MDIDQPTRVLELNQKILKTINEIKTLELKLKKLKKEKSILIGQECFLEEIPSDLILNFCAFLDPKDILAFGSCSKDLHNLVKQDYLWNLLLKDRFKVHADPGQALKIYKSKYSKTSRLYGTDLNVTWLDDNHWKKVATSIELIFVWWFEVRGTFLGVRAGKYQPILHGKFHGAENISNISISIRSRIEGQSSISEFSFTNVDELDDPDRIYLPPITVGDENGYPTFQDLQVDMLDFDSGLLKQGIRIDYFELQKIV